MDKILELLENDSTLTPQQLAVMIGRSVSDVENAIEQYKKDNVIVTNKTVINWEKTDKEFVTALIELKVIPQRGEGFDKISERIYQYPEVKSLYLMAGGYDLMVIIEGRTMREVSSFVSGKLATMECVTGTATHFVLKKYKDDDIIFGEPHQDMREVMSL